MSDWFGLANELCLGFLPAWRSRRVTACPTMPSPSRLWTLAEVYSGLKVPFQHSPRRQRSGFGVLRLRKSGRLSKFLSDSKVQSRYPRGRGLFGAPSQSRLRGATGSEAARRTKARLTATFQAPTAPTSRASHAGNWRRWFPAWSRRCWRQKRARPPPPRRAPGPPPPPAPSPSNTIPSEPKTTFLRD